MKITSSKPKGQRMFKSIKHYHTTHRGKKIKHKRPFWIEPIGKNWWFDLYTGEWTQKYNGKGGMTTSYYYRILLSACDLYVFLTRLMNRFQEFYI